MYLSSLELDNFRSFDKDCVRLQQDLTVLVGENNGGKSNLIDAIRLLTAPQGGRREIYCEETDVRFESGQKKFEITATFSELSAPQQGRLLSGAINDSIEPVQFGVTYDAEEKRPPVKPTFWAGQFRSPPEAGSHEMIRHVYLPPLRDAKYALASGNPTRIYALLTHFLGERSPEEVAKSLGRSETDPILDDVKNAVMERLAPLTNGVRRQVAGLGFSQNERLLDIARDLKFKLADNDVDPEELQYSGHGFANLLYMATIAVELEKVADAELTVFLVEEPEAHLHPQLQAAVLSFLEEQAEKSRTRTSREDPIEPAGQLQVVVATHSPNLSAWVKNEKIVYVRSVLPLENSQPSKGHHSDEADDATRSRRVSRCIPLEQIDLTEFERRKIDRYLDVTKSSFLFGGRVMLVEGIAEALLLPVIAKYHAFPGNEEKYRRFRAATFVAIDGVDFDPYVKILLTPFNSTRICERLVLITDGDKSNQTGAQLPGQKRKDQLERVARYREASDNLTVAVSTYTLESELIEAGNEQIMESAFLELYRDSKSSWDQAIVKTGDDRAKAVENLFKHRRKGDFAQVLAERIASYPDFKIPDYLTQALEALVENSDAV